MMKFCVLKRFAVLPDSPLIVEVTYFGISDLPTSSPSFRILQILPLLLISHRIATTTSYRFSAIDAGEAFREELPFKG